MVVVVVVVVVVGGGGGGGGGGGIYSCCVFFFCKCSRKQSLAPKPGNNTLMVITKLVSHMWSL